jgi:DNA end-binding protein Ku
MAARSTWKGFLKLSLVSIPVKAYTATPSQAGEVKLNQLHAGCNSRIKYQKVCPIHGEVKQDEIVSGYEYSKDQYVVIDPNEIDKLRTEDSKSVAIQEFIAEDAVDPMYFSGATHYLVPDGPVGQRPYSVLYEGMVEEKRVAIAQMVWHGKERVVLLRPLEGLITMSTLSYDQEITKPSAFSEEVPKIDIAAEELKLAKTLIGAATSKKFDFSKYKDTYTEKLTKLIEAKVSGQEIVAAPHQEEVHVINLMDALKQSVAKLQKSEVEAKPEPKMAPSKKGRGTAERKKKSS